MRSSWLASTALLFFLGLSSASCFRHPLVEDPDGATGPDATASHDTRTGIDGDDLADGLRSSDGTKEGPDVVGPSRDTASEIPLDAMPESPDTPAALGDGPLSDAPQPTTDTPDDVPITGMGGASGTAGQSGTGGGGSSGTTSLGTGGARGGSGGTTTADAAPSTDAGLPDGAGTGGSSTGGSSTGGSVTGGASTGGAATGGTVTTAPLPVTTIATHPASITNAQTGTFTFTNTSAQVTYKCKLDAGTFAPCDATYTTPTLTDGSHTLFVQATDSGGRPEQTPPSYTWVIDTVAPNTLIVNHPANPMVTATGSFTFSSANETSAVSYECQLDAGDFAACDAAYATPALTVGKHTLAVRAKDAAGNTDATPATYTWEYVPGTEGCGKTPNLKNSSTNTPVFNTITSSGSSRQYILRYPDNYDENHPYRLIIAYHWNGGSAAQVYGCEPSAAPCAELQDSFYGLWDLASDSTIFIAPDGVNAGWANTGGRDLVLTDDVLTEVGKDLCIDKSRIFANGFSYGAAMTYAIACDRAEVFRGVALYAGAQLSGCVDGTKPIAFYSAHGLGDMTFNIQTGRNIRDKLVANNGCTAQTPPEPTVDSGTHICTTYSGCSAGHPVVWCAFDGGHVPFPVDVGQTTSWVPRSTWDFLSQF